MFALKLFKCYSFTKLVDEIKAHNYNKVTPKKHGTKWARLVTSIILDSAIPKPVPNKVDAVNCETVLPWISPILLFLANYKLILALEADARSQQTFLPIFATDAISRK